MRKFLFLGAERTGKSSVMLFMAKILAELQKKVLVIDTTYSQGVRSSFYFNNDIENINMLEKCRPIVRDNFEIIFGQPYSVFEFKKLDEINFHEYDYVFIEGDISITNEIVKTADLIFLFQDSDRNSLVKNQIILKKFDIEAGRLTFVFNNIIDTNYDVTYLIGELISCLKYTVSDEINESIEIEFDEQDITSTLDSRNEGIVDLKGLTGDYKLSLYELVNQIEEIDKKTYSRILK